MILSLIAFLTGLLALGLRLHDVWDKWRARRHPVVTLVPLHPLDARLADIAAAIRERGPDLHLRLRDVPPGPGPGARTP
jgi:hypothetical protein